MSTRSVGTFPLFFPFVFSFFSCSPSAETQFSLLFDLVSDARLPTPAPTRSCPPTPSTLSPFHFPIGLCVPFFGPSTPSVYPLFYFVQRWSPYTIPFMLADPCYFVFPPCLLFTVFCLLYSLYSMEFFFGYWLVVVRTWGCDHFSHNGRNCPDCKFTRTLAAAPFLWFFNSRFSGVATTFYRLWLLCFFFCG